MDGVRGRSFGDIELSSQKNLVKKASVNMTVINKFHQLQYICYKMLNLCCDIMIGLTLLYIYKLLDLYF